MENRALARQAQEASKFYYAQMQQNQFQQMYGYPPQMTMPQGYIVPHPTLMANSELAYVHPLDPRGHVTHQM